MFCTHIIYSPFFQKKKLWDHMVETFIFLKDNRNYDWLTRNDIYRTLRAFRLRSPTSIGTWTGPLETKGPQAPIQWERWRLVLGIVFKVPNQFWNHLQGSWTGFFAFTGFPFSSFLLLCVLCLFLLFFLKIHKLKKPKKYKHIWNKIFIHLKTGIYFFTILIKKILFSEKCLEI